MTTESMRVYVSPEKIAEARAVIRYNADASVCMVWRDGEPLREARTLLGGVSSSR